MKKFIAVRVQDKKIIEGFGVCYIEEFGEWILFTKSIKYINDMEWEVESYEVIDVTTLALIK